MSNLCDLGSKHASNRLKNEDAKRAHWRALWRTPDDTIVLADGLKLAGITGGLDAEPTRSKHDTRRAVRGHRIEDRDLLTEQIIGASNRGASDSRTGTP